jgi:hypothetical protein
MNLCGEEIWKQEERWKDEQGPEDVGRDTYELCSV